MAAKNRVRVGRIVRDVKPTFPGFMNIVCLTPSTTWGELGPYVLKDENGHIMENIYQSKKCYIETPEVKQTYSRWDKNVIWQRKREVHIVSKSDLPVDFDNLGYVELATPIKGIKGVAFLTPEYFKWREDLRRCPYPVRYPVGMAHRKHCVGSISDQQLEDYKLNKNPIHMLSYIEGRKQIYVPIYQALVLKAPKFQKLLELSKKHNLLIIEVDGPHQESLSYYVDKYKVDKDFIVDNTIEITEKNLDIMLNDTLHPYGHGYALAELLINT